MFIQDIASYIVPSRYPSEKFPEFSLSLSGDSAFKNEALALLASIGRDRTRNLEHIVLANFINTVARDLAWSGLVRYEIYANSNSNGERVLGYIPSIGSIRLLGCLVQIIPRIDREMMGQTFALLPMTDVWEVAIPASLGGARGYRRLIRQLRACGHLMPPFYLRGLEKGEPPNFVDVAKYRSVREERIAAVTRQWGWTWRNVSLRGITEFYYFYRVMTHCWTQALLREHIVERANSLLAKLKIPVVLNLSGLPSPEKVLQLREQMSLGNLTFGKAYKSVSII